MAINEHIEQLIKQAEEDLGAAQALSDAGYYGHSLFWLHLVLEKLCKAVWVKKNSRVAYPYIHNLLRLLKESNVEITEEQSKFYSEMNQYQSLGRYGDDLQKIEASVTMDICNQYFEKANTEILWLKKVMQ